MVKNMKDVSSVIQDLENLSDCKNLDNNTKYVTIDITNVNTDVISHLQNKGKNLLITDRINEKRGFVFVDYNTFLIAQNIIDEILNNMPKSLSKLEIARYLYISLGKIVGFDINILDDKNDFFSLNNINTVNNIWNALATSRVSNISLAKAYMYLCSYFNIKCEIVSSTDNGYLSNKIKIDDNYYIVNLSRDIAYIQAGFPTTSFASFNNDIEMDKKIGYIKKEYNDKLIDKALTSIDYMQENAILEILVKTQKILKINDIKPVELGFIYNYIFNKYCPNYGVSINNLYYNNNSSRKHFIMISYNDKHYSYNYRQQSFLIVDEPNLINNLENNKIGLYMDEFIPNLNISHKVL